MLGKWHAFACHFQSSSHSSLIHHGCPGWAARGSAGHCSPHAVQGRDGRVHAGPAKRSARRHRGARGAREHHLPAPCRCVAFAPAHTHALSLTQPVLLSEWYFSDIAPAWLGFLAVDERTELIEALFFKVPPVDCLLALGSGIPAAKSVALPVSHSHSLTHTHPHSLTHAHSHTLTHSHTHSHSLTHAHSCTLTLTPSHTLTDTRLP
jgi:hypothetical protein